MHCKAERGQYKDEAKAIKKQLEAVEAERVQFKEKAKLAIKEIEILKASIFSLKRQRKSVHFWQRQWNSELIAEEWGTRKESSKIHCAQWASGKEVQSFERREWGNFTFAKWVRKGELWIKKGEFWVSTVSISKQRVKGFWQDFEAERR